MRRTRFQCSSTISESAFSDSCGYQVIDDHFVNSRKLQSRLNRIFPLNNCSAQVSPQLQTDATKCKSADKSHNTVATESMGHIRSPKKSIRIRDSWPENVNNLIFKVWKLDLRKGNCGRKVLDRRKQACCLSSESKGRRLACKTRDNFMKIGIMTYARFLLTDPES